MVNKTVQLAYKVFVIVFVALAFIAGQSVEASNDPLATVLAWSQDGKLIAIGYSDGKIEIIEAQSKEKLQEWVAHNQSVTVLAWSTDNHYLATSSYDRTVKTWDVSNPESTPNTLPDLDLAIVYDLAWSDDNRYIILAKENGNDNLAIWDTVSNKYILTETIPTPTEIKWNPDLHWLAVSYLWPTIDLRSWTTFRNEFYIGTLPQHYATATDASILAFDWAPDGDLIISGGLGGFVVLWSLETHQNVYDPVTAYDKEPTKDDSQIYIRDIWFSPTGEAYTTIVSDGTYRTWKTTDGKILTSLNLGSSISVVQISPDKTHLAYIDDEDQLHIIRIIYSATVTELQNKVEDCVGDKGIQTSLLAKLNAEQLTAFINELEAQRGKQIPTDCANELLIMVAQIQE